MCIYFTSKKCLYNAIEEPKCTFHPQHPILSSSHGLNRVARNVRSRSAPRGQYNATHPSILTSMNAELFHGWDPAPIGVWCWPRGWDPWLRPVSIEVARCWCPLLFLPFPCHEVNHSKMSILATWTQKGLQDQAEEEGSMKKRKNNMKCKFYKKV